MEKPGNKQDEESEEDWKLLFELYEILKKRVDAREEKMRDYVRKVGLTAYDSLHCYCCSSLFFSFSVKPTFLT